MRSLGAIGGPTSVEGIRSDNTTKVTQARHESGGGSDADLTVAALEDLVGPGHAGGHGGAEAEADEEETAVAGPGVLEGEGGG